MVLSRSPTLTTITVFLVVFVLQSFADLVGALAGLFVLSPPLETRPWTLVTSVYAHGGPGHLLANSLALLIPGFVIEHRTSASRYHAFFIATGATAGVAEVRLGVLVGEPTGVLGASGAVFAFIGYLLSSNRLADTAIRGFALSGVAQIALFALVAVVLTFATAAPEVALVAHFTGLFVGLVAGRTRLLRTTKRGARAGPHAEE